MEILFKCKRNHVVLITRCDLVDFWIWMFYQNFEEITGKFWEITGKYGMLQWKSMGSKGLIQMFWELYIKVNVICDMVEIHFKGTQRKLSCIFRPNAMLWTNIIISVHGQHSITVFSQGMQLLKIKSGPLWFWGPAQCYLYYYSDNSEAISVIISVISYLNNVLSPYRNFLKLQVGELMHIH